MCISDLDDDFESEDCPELDEAVFILKHGESVKLEVEDDVDACDDQTR